MKKLIGVMLTIACLLAFASCDGNFAQVDLQQPVSIPENGIIDKSTLDQVKSDNAIVTFTGTSDGIKYDWVVFGSNITSTRDVNLSVDIQKTEQGVSLSFAESKPLGFSAVLSVYLDEKWSSDGATAYYNGEEVYKVSLTGSKTTILNVTIDSIVPDCEIIPHKSPDDEASHPSEESETSDEVDDTSAFDESSPDTSEVEASEDESFDRVYSDGTDTGKDGFNTDPVPDGKPLPVEPDEQDKTDKPAYTCIISIECLTILNNLADLEPDKLDILPSDGVILPPTEVTFYEGESVFDVLARVCKDKGIHLEFVQTPIYNSACIEGIGNLYEFDCGPLSGWAYRVNGWYPNYGCSRYRLVDGETVEWRYTCDLGKDIGCDRIGENNA